MAVLWACGREPWPDPPTIDRAAFLSEHATWRSSREQGVRDNWVGLAGLWPLDEERTAFGPDGSARIGLASPSSPQAVGTFVRRGRIVQIEPIGSKLLLSNNDGPYRPIDSAVVLHTDADSVPSYVRLGSVRLWVHVVGAHDYVRVLDDSSPRRRGFTLAPEYAPDPQWRVVARFHPYRKTKVYRIADITGDEETVRVPGELVFPIHGRQFHLRAFTEEDDSTLLWLMFRDSTNLRETYGAGRYLWVPAPDSAGWTIIDFNRAISPPCAYTAYATCVLPPRENRLAVRIAAGEQRSH